MKSEHAISEYFRKCHIDHQRLREVHAKAMHHIRTAPPGTILMIIGPSGTGKSHTGELCVRDGLEYFNQSPSGSCMPPIHIDIPVGSEGRFARRGLYEEILDSLQEPGIDSKIDFDQYIEMLRENKKVGHPTYNAQRLDALGKQVNTACQYRKPIALILDEAGHLVTSPQAHVQSKNLDVIKWHSNQISTPIVLIGGYDDHHMLEVSAQLSNRVKVVVFSRYREQETEIEYFTSIWQSLEEDLEIPFSSDVKKAKDYVYTHTLGCVGVLTKWFCDGLIKASDEGSKCLKKRHLAEFRKSNAQLQSMARTIDALEPVYTDCEDFERDLSQADWTISSVRESKPATNRRPGVRKPKRDPYKAEPES